MTVYIVARDCDNGGYHAYGVYSSREKAKDAIVEFCVRETDRLRPTAECNEKEFYLIESNLDSVSTVLY